jgi:hypothetical protein
MLASTFAFQSRNAIAVYPRPGNLTVIENRRHPRSSIDLPVMFAVQGSETFEPGTATNISIGGIYVETDSPAPFGTEIIVRIPLRSPTSDERDYDLPGTVRWVRADGMGIQFGLLGAVETHGITELCRLVSS